MEKDQGIVYRVIWATLPPWFVPIVLVIIAGLLLSGCGANVYAATNTTEYQSPRPTATQSQIPTVEYKATANAAETQAGYAQATADEANRVMVQATNDQQQRDHEAAMQNAQATQHAESEDFVRESWTATAALTSVPLTATAQVDNSTAIAAYNAMTIAQLTATAALPTQIVAVSNAKAQAKFAPILAGVQVFAIFGLAVFLLFASWFMRWYWMREDKRAEVIAHAQSPQGIAERHGFTPVPEVEFIQPTEPTETIINLHTDNGGGNISIDRLVVPCTKNQLLQVAENVLANGWTLGINQWESAGTLFTRNTFSRLRSWLQGNKFAVSAGNGALALSPEGHRFLEEFLNTSLLPTEYQFEEIAQ